MHLKNVSLGISLAVQWFRLYFHGRGMAFICGGELRFHMLCTIAKRKLKKKKNQPRQHTLRREGTKKGSSFIVSAEKRCDFM